MSTALEIAERVVAEAPQSFYRYEPTLGRMESFCQQFVGNFLTEAGVVYSGSYASADAARRDSDIYTDDWRQASPGDIVYLTPNHVGIYEGGGFMLSATGWATKALLSLGKSVYRHRVDDYAKHLHLAGFSHTNGKRPRITGLTSPAGGDVSPFPTIERNDDMPTIYWDGQDYTKTPSPAWFGVLDNGRMYTTQDAALISRIEAATGTKRIDCGSSAKFNDLMGILQRAIPVTGGTGGTTAAVDLAPMVAAINALGVKLDGLPAEIDAYSDGKKQS